MDNKDYNLRPCPFCGGHASFRAQECSSRSNTSISFVIECDKCGTQAPVSQLSEVAFAINRDGSIKITSDDRQMEADVWNGVYRISEEE